MKQEKRQPWMKWYPADFRSEPTLRMVDRAARSFWVDLLGLMHEAEPYGHLVIGGVVPTTRQIASVLGDSERDVKRWLDDLLGANVYSVTDAGVIYSRRMVRDKAKAIRDAQNGSGGGNPYLKGQDKGGVNPPDNRSDNAGDKAQRLDAICQPEANASGGARSRRRSPELPLPSDWEPLTRHYAKAAGLGLTAEHVPRLAGRMRTWAATHDHRRRNWDAQFDSFIETEAKNGGQHGRFDANGDTARDAELRRRRAENDAAMVASSRDGSVEAALWRDDDGEGSYNFGRA